MPEWIESARCLVLMLCDVKERTRLCCNWCFRHPPHRSLVRGRERFREEAYRALVCALRLKASRCLEHCIDGLSSRVGIAADGHAKLTTLIWQRHKCHKSSVVEIDNCDNMNKFVATKCTTNVIRRSLRKALASRKKIQAKARRWRGMSAEQRSPMAS
jgi:hypothetical protein